MIIMQQALSNVSTYTPEVATRVWQMVSTAAGQPDIRAAVEANHDENRWWPTTIADWRLRMAIAGWSTRISYNMITTYARVAQEADNIGYDQLRTFDDDKLFTLVAPLGLPLARIRYFRSLNRFLRGYDASNRALLQTPTDELIARFAASVHQAGFKVAQCAVLYAHGYHCGIIPVDSGMVTKLAPCLDLHFSRNAYAHERMRQVLQACVNARASDYHELIKTTGHEVTVPAGVAPTWWVHLVLIYFKRLYCNQSHPRLCPERPVCSAVFDCACSQQRRD